MGRLGKVLQLVAGLTIVAEIVGAPALRRFGNSLHGRVQVADLTRAILDVARWQRLLFRYLFMTRASDGVARLRDELETYKAHNVSLVLAIGFALYFGFWIPVSDNPFLQVLATFGVALILEGIVCPLSVTLLVAVAAMLGALLDALVLEPVAWLLERNSLDRIIKLFACVLLVVGFHFDFLAT